MTNPITPITAIVSRLATTEKMIGEKIHHQLQAMTPTSFKVMKTAVRVTARPPHPQLIEILFVSDI
jgi:hypothetical protein